MRSVFPLVVLVSVFGVVFGGVGVVTPEIEAEALRLWAAFCEGSSEGGTDGSNFIFCKKSSEVIEETLSHEASLSSPDGAPKDQVIFVQPPSYNYVHDVIVKGGASSPGKVTLFVKPPRHTHEIKVTDQTTGGEGGAPKPVLYFLKSHAHGGTGNTDAAAASPGGYAAADGPPAADVPVEEAPPAPETAEEVARRRRGHRY